MKISSKESDVQTILQGNFFFVPRFQRPYSWTKDNVEEFWEDAVQERSGDYFIGSMVVYPGPSGSKAVIDGQQRLTTLLMLLSAIRNVAEEYGLTDLETKTHAFVERPDPADDEPRSVLQIDRTYPFLHDQVFARGPAELNVAAGGEEQGLQDAFKRLTDYVSQTAESISANPSIPEKKKQKAIENELRSIRNKVLDLQLIFIEVEDRDEATTIFVTLNSRGRDLEPSDLVKAHLLNLLPKKAHVDRPYEKWEQITDMFDKSEVAIDTTDFLVTSWQSRYEQSTKKSLVKAVRKSIKKAEAADFLDELVADSRTHRAVVEPEYRNWNPGEVRARSSLEYFAAFQIHQPRPLLLSLLREFELGNIKTAALVRSLRAIENYHFVWNTLAGKSSSGGMSKFYGVRARALHHAETAQERGSVISEFVSELNQKRPSRAEFDEELASLRVSKTQTADRRRTQFLLRRLYESHSPTNAFDLTLTIEHIKPQRDGEPSDGAIGNLILVTSELNDELGAKTYAKKREILKAVRDQWIPEDAYAAKTWTKASIEKRTAALIQEAATLWGMPDPVPPEED